MTTINFYSEAIAKAKEKLKNSPYDIYHTLEHYKEVVDIIFDIIQHENLSLQTNLLEIAAWWHDVYKGDSQETQHISKELKKLGLSETNTSQIVEIISNHSFGQEQNTLEDKLLYDADKITFVSIPRWENAFNSYSNGKISIEERDKYIPEWNRRMHVLKNTFNFTYSKNLFGKMYKEFVKWLKLNERWNNGRFV